MTVYLQTMKQILQIAAATLLCGMAAACDSSESGDSETTAGIDLRISRAEAQAASPYDFRAHMNRIYVGERKPEHNKSELHVREISDLYSIDNGESLQFRMTQLKAQWYKFIILSVPKIYPGTEGIDVRNFGIFSEEQPDESSCDLNRHFIDYTPILEKAPGTTAPDVPAPDGDIFRAVLNCWAKNNLLVEEKITLKRINGRLDIDMGILTDQFPQHINRIIIEVTTPSHLYLSDDNKEVVKSSTPRTFTYTTRPDDLGALPESQHRHHIISLPLLPGLLQGTITVDAADKAYTYNISSSGDELSIKPNTVTRLRFNGMAEGFFDVRYAGYNDTGINVEEDWNGGWN